FGHLLKKLQQNFFNLGGIEYKIFLFSYMV
ncbi:unnamed protein product, partial [marine sediment metagenome]